ncbi:hypothetical protein [Rickettsiella endosymbiont of Xylota segnis]|uniref:hypothetical protein n=1 Tax=Rickettsiella endosymbiont of Xylota segnis TaxID=3066238 RepID=UPI0030D2ECD0
MLESDVVSVTEDLVDRNYQKFLKGSRQIGRSAKKLWDDKILQETGKTPKNYKFSSDPKFKEFLYGNHIKTSSRSTQLQTPIKDDVQHIQQLKNKLSYLALFFVVWKDTAAKDNLNSSQESAEKKLRQEIKFKSNLDKDDRYAINIALQSMVFILCQQSELIVDQDKDLNDFITQFTQLDKEDLPEFISKRILDLNKLESNPNYEVSHEDPLDIQQEIEKIGAAISAFQTPNIKKKIIKYTGILLAFIASIACGAATGGAFFLLFPSLPVLGFILGGLIGIWGFSSNFGFFSQNFPNFLLSFLKKGGISEYIDEKGNRRQLSALKKYLLIPLAAMASFTVGLGTVAITYTTVIALAGKLFVISALWPPLFPIIAGILAAAVGITLTVAVLTATIEAIKNSQNFSWENVKNTLNNLSTRQIIGYLFKSLLVIVGLLGLAYFRYVAGIDLSNIIQPIVGLQTAPIIAAIMGAIAYIPQGFFTVLSIQKLTRLFSPSENISQEEAASLPQSLYSRTKSRITKTYKSISLIGNAFGNAVLVVVDSISALSIFGAIGCFFNSWSGNLVEPPKNQQARSQATQLLINQVNDLNKKVIKPSASTDDFENSQRKLNFGFELKEPTGLPSPVVSENGSCLISGNIGYSMGGNGPELFKTPHSSNSSDGSSNSKSRLAPAANH